VDLAAVFVLSLLGGYCFAYIWRGSALNTKLLEGHHLYFRAALCGAIFFLISLILRAALIQNFSAYQALDSTLVEYVRPALKEEAGIALAQQTRRSEWVVTSIYSLLIGLLSGVALNLFTPRGWALQRSSNSPYALLIQVQYQQLTVMLTLNTGKVYIGTVVAVTDPAREPQFVSLLPILSGYRDTEGRLNLTTDYDSLYSQLEHGRASQLGLAADFMSEFKMTIRAADIVTTARFSLTIYNEFNPGWKQRIAERNRQRT
jgi:hypothetical protein